MEEELRRSDAGSVLVVDGNRAEIGVLRVVVDGDA